MTSSRRAARGLAARRLGEVSSLTSTRCPEQPALRARRRRPTLIEPIFLPPAQGPTPRRGPMAVRPGAGGRATRLDGPPPRPPPRATPTTCRSQRRHAGDVDAAPAAAPAPAVQLDGAAFSVSGSRDHRDLRTAERPVGTWAGAPASSGTSTDPDIGAAVQVAVDRPRRLGPRPTLSRLARRSTATACPQASALAPSPAPPRRQPATGTGDPAAGRHTARIGRPRRRRHDVS